MATKDYSNQLRACAVALCRSRASVGLCDELGSTLSMGAVDTSADDATCEGFTRS
ncbi:hypothetical protein JHN63_43105 [Streptomyces sp. MBT65]|uniref:hypothetical protein n=1 Tax=Streptomyces sp. MBT65 TaxID=1488395 RepID=UPI00190A3505|nr:hypothetical protein [Streptomyces sp. MBT65]MBK3580463.1 hypothetical protein [Streptomyces sp. MBT65]